MRKLLVTGLLLASALPSSAGFAATTTKQTMTCPIGGASFDYAAPIAQASVGERPDGKPYGSPAPLALPECPDNGLVLYKEYSPEEAAKLEPLITSDAYKAMRQGDTQYYRAYWLMKEMGLKPEAYLWALLQASWEAEATPELRKRYLTELAEASAKVPARPADLNWIGMEGRAINALRELGRFEEAQARLEKVPLGSLEAAAPAPGAQGAGAQQARVKRGWLHYFQQMKTVLARKDASLEPFELLPRSIAFGRCIEAKDLSEAQRGFCEAEKAGVDQFRAVREQQAKELEALRKSREESGR